ncbi:MAG: PEGA domain-containing protein [Candidatus Omnitrophica bacterium]|nr:PEGA domain-containing protein [Candidatus Omnitrophota bacterium]
MKNTDKIMRSIAFYTALAAFFILLPIVLSYALGYKIDYHSLKVYKTGIIHVSSHPAGASVYINGKPYNDLTPMSIEDLKPGIYKVEVRREGFYPWEREMEVRPNMVTKADRIILFPVTREMKKVATSEIADFAISENGKIYYLTRYGLFRSDLDGGSLKKLLGYSDWPKNIISKKFSPEMDKLLYFDNYKVFVIQLDVGKMQPKGGEIAKVEEVFASPDPIVDVFWYPGSNYIMTVSEKDIKVIELREGVLKRNIASIYKFNSRPQGVYYNDDAGILYFTDKKSDAVSDEDRFLYKLELKDNFFENIIRMLVKKETNEGYEKR